jgi:hypothetical protein
MENQNEKLTLEELKSKRESILGTLKDLQVKISKFGITGNRRNYSPHTINLNHAIQKEKYVQEFNELQKEVIDINKYIRLQASKPDYLRQVLKDCLPPTIHKALMQECQRREQGEAPLKIGLDTEVHKNYKDKIELMTKTLKEYHDTLIKARTEISNYIDLHYPEEHNAQIKFMRDYSAVNTSIQQKNYYLSKRRIVGY